MNFVAFFFFTVLFLSVSELFLLVHVSALIGFAATLGLCILTGILGGSLVRYQGLQTLKRMQGELASGKLPADEILEGIVLIVVGALLLVPGFLTDIFGFLMLIPPLRRAAVTGCRAKLTPHIHVVTPTMGPMGQPPMEEEVIDVECEER